MHRACRPLNLPSERGACPKICALPSALLATPASLAYTRLERTAQGIFGLFGPSLALALVTLVAIGAGLGVFLGRLSVAQCARILAGAVLVVGAPSVWSRIEALLRVHH